MNKTMLLGRLTKDIELRYSPSGTAFASFNLAVPRKYNKPGEEKQSDFPNCKVFGKTAEFMSKYLVKGSQIAIEGRIQTGSYEKDGVKHYTCDVMVGQVDFADSKKPVGGGDAQEPSGFNSQNIVDELGNIVDDDELPF